MKKEFKVQAISEKVEVLEVNGQVTQRCLNNCTRYYYEGYSSSKQGGCKRRPYHDAYMSIVD